jgi:hypothetical protein
MAAMRRLPAFVVLGVVAVSGGSACREDTGNTGERYCGQIKTHLKRLNEPSIDTAPEIQVTLEIYRAITDAAPAAIEPEWQQLLLNIETASTVDPDDAESLQRVADVARSSMPAATRVQQYTDQLCALKIEDPPPVTNPVTVTTTIPGPNTSAPPTSAAGG